MNKAAPHFRFAGRDFASGASFTGMSSCTASRRLNPPSPGVAYLHARGVRLTDVADAMGVGVASTSHWFTGRRSPPSRFLSVLARLLGDEDDARFVMSLVPRHAAQRVSPMAQALRARGLSIGVDVAPAVGACAATVSNWANARNPAPTRLRPVLDDLLGDDAGPVIASMRWQDGPS